jgi:hypothetical protein
MTGLCFFGSRQRAHLKQKCGRLTAVAIVSFSFSRCPQPMVSMWSERENETNKSLTE